MVGLETQAQQERKAEIVKVLDELLATKQISQELYDIKVAELNLTKEDLKAKREEKQIVEAVYRAASKLTPEQKKQSDEIVRRLKAQQDELGLTDRQLQRAITRARDSFTSGFGMDTEDTIRNAVVSGLKRGFESGDWKAAALSIIADIFAESLRSARDSEGGGGIAGVARFFANFGGGRARGGPVRGNIGYLVGENGPEFLIPGQDGFVQPLQNSLSRGAAGAPVTNVINFNGTDFTRDMTRNLNTFAGRIQEIALPRNRHL